MPLPQQVIEQLGREPPKTPGWSFGIITFSGGIFAVILFVYFGLVFGYEPYLNSQITAQENKINQLGQSISSDDQTKLVNFYSQLANLRTLLKSHTLSTQFLTWLEKNTEANVYYETLTLAPDGQVTLMANAKTEADVNQALAIFEHAPEVKKVSVTNVATSQAAGGWTFTATLTLDPTVFLPAAI